MAEERAAKRQRRCGIIPNAGSESLTGNGLYEDAKRILSEYSYCENVYAASQCACKKDSPNCLAGPSLPLHVE